MANKICKEVNNVENKNWISKKDVAKNFGVDTDTLENCIKQINLNSGTDSVIQNHIKKGGYHNLAIYYDDELVTMIGMQLKKNAINQGKQSEVIKQDNKQDLFIGCIATKGSPEEIESLAEHLKYVAQQKRDNLSLESENRQLKHALEYDKIVGWKGWNEIKQNWKENFDQLKHRVNFSFLVNEIPLIEDIDFTRKVMGDDKFPTTMISPSGEDKLWNFFDN